MSYKKICFDELPKIVDSVLVITKYDNKFIYVKNKKRKWELTGGHIECGESVVDTAVREAYEEAGAVIQKENVKIHGYYVLEDGHVTAITTANADKLVNIPTSSETVERVLTEVPLEDDLLSFPDGLYYKIFKRLGLI